MGYVKIGKMPYKIGESKSLHTSLCRAYEIKYYSYQKERQYVTLRDFMPTAPDGHQKIGRSCHNRYKHSCTENNGNGLQPPWQRTKHKVMGSDKGIKQHLCPECQ